MVGWIKKMMMDGWIKKYEKNMDGWMDKKNEKIIDGWWMDRQIKKNRWMVGWIEKNI